MGVSQEEGSIMHGYTKPKATSEQCLSKLGLAELQTPGKSPPAGKKKKKTPQKIKREKQTGTQGHNFQ